MDRAKEFRQKADQLNGGRSRIGRRYPDDLKALAINHGEFRRREGWGWAAIAEELEISLLTLRRWIEARSRGGFVPVEVVEQPFVATLGERGLIAITPGGLRIEGLSWSETLELARVFR